MHVAVETWELYLISNGFILPCESKKTHSEARDVGAASQERRLKRMQNVSDF
jgi:hypothetical protein